MIISSANALGFAMTGPVQATDSYCLNNVGQACQLDPITYDTLNQTEICFTLTLCLFLNR